MILINKGNENIFVTQITEKIKNNLGISYRLILNFKEKELIVEIIMNAKQVLPYFICEYNAPSDLELGFCEYRVATFSGNLIDSGLAYIV